MYFRVILSVASLLIYAGLANATPFAYIANNADDTVSVLDTATNTVTKLISDGIGNGPYGVAVNRMGSRVYVSNTLDNSISVIDTMDDSASKISLTSQPGGLAVNSAGTRLFVANPAASTITVINASTKLQIGSPIAVASCQPAAVAAGPADVGGNYNVYISCAGTGKVGILTANDGSPTPYVISGTEVALTGIVPQGIAVSKDGKRVYVGGSSSVAVIDTANLTNLPTVLTHAQFSMVTGIAVDPSVADSANPTKLYITNMGSDRVSVLTATGNSVAYNADNFISVGSGPWGIAFTRDGTKAVTSNYFSSGTASVITKSSDAVFTTPDMTVGNIPKSFGSFAGPNFTKITTVINDNSCGTVTPQELITPNALSEYKVAQAEPVKFSITPDGKCSTLSVTVDAGANLVPLTEYLFPSPSADTTLKVDFTRNLWDIKVTKTGTGNGTVTSTINNVPDGKINCGSTCTGTYSSSTNFITIIKSIDEDSEFVGWSGSGCGGKETCFFKVDAVSGATHATSGTYEVFAEYRLKPSGPVRTNRGGAVKYKTLLQDAYAAIVGATAANPIDIDKSKDFTLTTGSNVAITLVGGWNDWTTGGIGTISGASNITGPFTVSLGSVTIGSYNNLGAIIIK